MKEFW